MNYYGIILIAVSLSIDAFSLSLAYGLMNLSKKKIILASITVGIFHFFMPLLGLKTGSILLSIIPINPKVILLCMFLIVIIEMIKSINEKVEKKALNIPGTLAFAFLVSIDSFSLGIGLSYIAENIYIAASIFSITSFLFTLLGFFLGKFISTKAEKYSKFCGIFMMFTLLIYYLRK